MQEHEFVIVMTSERKHKNLPRWITIHYHVAKIIVKRNAKAKSSWLFAKTASISSSRN